MWTAVLSVMCLLLLSHPIVAHREHKVHNIVLYPDKQSWCKTTAIKQVVTSPGYKQTTIDNNVCVGACFSYSIPRTQPAEPGELIVPYCDSCQPLTTRCYHVTLQADDENTDGPKTKQKRVQIITNCTCSSCDKISTTDCELSNENTAELPTDLFSTENTNTDSVDSIQQSPVAVQQDIPELLTFVPNKTRSNAHGFDVFDARTKEQKYELNSKLIALLKSIQEHDDDDTVNFNYDKTQLRELLKIIEGSEHELSDKNLMEFVNFVNVYNSEDLELDLSRLKEVLTNFQKSQKSEWHKQFGLGKVDTGTELHVSTLENSGISKNSLPTTTNAKHFEKKHYLGEEQKLITKMGFGHLVRGPHDSLILKEDDTPTHIERLMIDEDSPSGVEEKLHVEPHSLKPNHAGTVLNYENHSKKHNPIEN